MKNKLITKADLILLIMIIILGTGTFFLVKMLAREGKHVRVSVDGKALMTVPLDKNDSYEIKGYDGGYNRLVIKGNISAKRTARTDCVLSRAGSEKSRRQ